MQTQHKVQLDARDKGQAPAGQPGPYQVTPAVFVLTAAFVFMAPWDAGARSRQEPTWFAKSGHGE